MTKKYLRDRLRPEPPLPRDNPELMKARIAALSRLIPMMYFILMANAWVLTATFIGKAPAWLTIDAALLLTVACAARLVVWWRVRNNEPTVQGAKREFRNARIMAAVLSVAFLAWGFALFPYGDELGQSHIAFFVTISIISTMFCLVHIRSAALIVAGIAGTAFVAYFGLSGVSSFSAMAINMILVLGATVVLVEVQGRDFQRMVDARTEARRRQQEQAGLLHMIDDMPIAVMTVNPDTLEITYANEMSMHTLRQIEHLLPVKVDDIVGTSIDVFHKNPAHQRRLLSDPANLPHRARIRLGPEVLDLQVSAVNDDDGNYIGPMLSWALVTKEAEVEERVRQLAHYDTLTGLPNRVTFREALAEHIATPGGRTALLLVDLDGFKLINDTRGHHVGDLVLKQVADRLNGLSAGHDMMIGRLGGDEFALLADIDADGAARLAEMVVTAINEPYRDHYDHTMQIGASVGIALAPAHGNDVKTLLARADIALYAAKADGKGSHRAFSDEMEARIKDRVNLEARLRAALKDETGLFVFYQPIVDIVTGRVTAREALARWHHPTQGWISPSEFVPVAEESGLIEPLGKMVLGRACREAAGWTDGARVSVNVSAMQLGRGTLAPAVLAALVDSGLEPGRLEIEVTETALLNDHVDALGDLRRLSDMGVRIALDDFGTGYSSLSHLRAFAFDKIKIDGSFVHDALTRADSAAIVRAVADIGRRLGVTTVAEGVETDAQLAWVSAVGCVEVQGFLCGRPAPSAADAEAVAALDRTAARALAG